MGPHYHEQGEIDLIETMPKRSMHEIYAYLVPMKTDNYHSKWK